MKPLGGGGTSTSIGERSEHRESEMQGQEAARPLLHCTIDKVGMSVDGSGDLHSRRRGKKRQDETRLECWVTLVDDTIRVKERIHVTAIASA